MLGHTGRSGVPFDIDEVLLAAKAKHKIIEINNHSLEHGNDAEHWDVCRKIAERCAELGVGIGVSTDAHIGMAIGKLDHARKMLDEIHFPLDLIVTRDREDAAARDGGSPRLRPAQGHVAAFINQVKGAVQTGRPFLSQNLPGWISGARGPRQSRCGRYEGTCRPA